MKIRKILSAVLCISVIVCLLTGCGGSKEPDYRTVTPPAGGWTKAQLLDVTYIGGNPMSRTPCWGDFRKNVKMDKSQCHEEDGFVTVKLTYNDSELCTLMYYNCISTVKEITDDLPIQMILFDKTNPIASKQFCINGVRMNDTSEAVREKLGEPNTGSERAFTYYTEDKMTLFIEFYKNQVWRVSIDGLTDE